MQQLFICRQGHRWQADPGAMPGEPSDLLHCPVCGEPTETTAFQELTLGAGPVASANKPGETTAFQDLGSQKANAAAPQFSLAPPITAFQDLGGTNENGGPSRPRLAPENVEFQELPARTGDNAPATNASGEPVAPGLDRSTAVTLHFPGVRREVLARPVPALPGYDILAEIGRSATSIVYQARETSQQRIVALKIITAGAYASPRQTAWLRAELEAVARLEHPCIARVYEVGEHAGRIHIAMEYVDGGTLEQKIHGKPQSASMAAQMAETLARTIVYVHERKLVHRNLKPGNILLTSEGMPRISDFAMARVADRSRAHNPEGTIGGNPSYMAPEHLEGEQSEASLQRTANPAMDIYALGAILYELITGRPPFLGASPADTAELARREDPLMPGQLRIEVPQALETICARCLQKLPERRYTSALELAEDLHRFLVDEPIKARPISVWERTWKAVQHRPLLVGAAALLLFSYMFLTVSLINHRSRLVHDLHQAATQAASAEQRLQSTRRALFLADMGMTREAWEEADRDSALKLLEKHRKDEDLRSFEWGYLWRVCHSDRLTLTPGRVHALAFSADSRTLATVGETAGEKDRAHGEIHLWDTTTGEAWATFAAPQAPVLAVALATAGRTLATGDAQGSIQLWDTLTGRERLSFSGHSAAVRSLAFTADGRTLASGSADGTVKLWEAQTGKELATLQGPVGAVTSVAFSPDGKLLAAGSQGDPDRNFGEIRLWDWSTRAQRAVLQGHRGPVQCVAFAPDSKTLASGGAAGKEGELKLWDVGANRHKVDLPGCFDGVVALAYAADGRTLAVAGDGGTLKLWNVENLPRLQMVLRAHAAPITALAFAADSDTLATASADNTAKIWSVVQALGGASLHDDKLPIRLPVNGLAFAQSGRVPVLASVGGQTGRAGEVRVWDAARGTLLAALDHGLDRALLAVAFSPDGQTLAAAGEDTTTKLWNWSRESPKGKASTTLKGHTHWVTSVAFSPRGKVVATGSADNTVRLWDADRGGELATLKGHLHQVQSVAFSPDGLLLASADAGSEVRVWKVSSRQEQLKITGHRGPVLAVAFSPDGKLLATAGGDLSVRLWDADTGKALTVMQGHAAPVMSVAFAPDGKSIASASRDGTVRLWDVITGQPRAILHGHADWVTALAFSPDGKALASASLDRTVKLWQGEEW